jgi:hypothetical protein
MDSAGRRLQKCYAGNANADEQFHVILIVLLVFYSAGDRRDADETG